MSCQEMAPKLFLALQEMLRGALKSSFVPARCSASARKREAYLVFRKGKDRSSRDANDERRFTDLALLDGSFCTASCS